jgi:hypothetical protein
MYDSLSMLFRSLHELTDILIKLKDSVPRGGVLLDHELGEGYEVVVNPLKKS